MAKPGSKLLKLLGWSLGLGTLAVLLAGVALRVFLPPEKIQKLVVEKVSEALHREVRLRGVSLSVLKGLTLDGLEVSENPDFAAGKFLAVDEFVLKVELMPLLRKKIVIDRISVMSPLLRVVKDKKGRFNFDDLTAESPAPKKTAEKTKPAAPIAFELKVRKASLSGGRIDYCDRQGGMTVQLQDIQAVATKLAFDQASGALSVTLDKFAAAVAGLELSVAGSVKLDPKKLEVPALHGRFNDADLKLSMTVRDYLKSPDISLDANLGKLDLDRLLAAKQSMMGQAAAAGPKDSSARPAAAPAGGAAPPIKTKGQAVIGQMTFGNANLKETKLDWALTGVTPDMRGLAGTAKLHIAGGTLAGERKESGRNGLMKALMLPVTVLQLVGKILSPLKILPDFNNLLFTEVIGDYVFSRGVMTIKDFHMDSAAAAVKTSGAIDLAGQTLSLLATISPAGIAPLEIDVTGAFDKPSIKPRLAKQLAAPVKKLTDEAGKLFKSLFKK